MQIALSKPKIKLIFFFSMIVAFSTVSLLAMNTAFLFTDKIYNGVSVGNVSVGGLSINEAKHTLEIAFADQTSHSAVTIQHEKKSWPISPEDIDLKINAENLAIQAHSVGRSGNIFKILQERYLTANGGYTLPFTQNYNLDKLKNQIIAIAQTVDKNPKNATLVYSNKVIEIIPEAPGQKVDIDSTLRDIENKLTTKMEFTSQLLVKQEAPTVLAKDFADIDTLLAVYTTEFDPRKENRLKNVELASNHINDKLIHAGEVFSFNQYVGLRLPEYGYKEAPVFIDGKLTLDWGGGVCQVSTTLYNAALLADMAIEERTSHFQPPAYVPLGQDAAVADNLLDFKFKNVTSSNIYIKSEVVNNRITVFIFGKNIANPPEIHIENESKTLEYNTIIKQDSSLPRGREVVESSGQKGFAVSTYRVKIANGKEISREKLSFDEFRPEDRVIRVGTKAQPSK